MQDLSEEAIKQNCPFCDPHSTAFDHPLLQTENFHLVCDSNPLIEGHLLIFPKQHISCIGAYPNNLYNEFSELYKQAATFTKETYGKVSTFEHGIFGQTVFHSHIHFLPFIGDPLTIVPEGEKKLKSLNDLTELKTLLNKEHGYLFFSIEDNMWTVDTSIAKPRFFRDRFAVAVGNSNRANWKGMRQNENIIKEVAQENVRTQQKWRQYGSTFSTKSA